MVDVIYNGYTGDYFTVIFKKATGSDYIREVFFGVLTILFCALSLALYAIVLRIISTEPDYKSNHSQRIMFHLGIADSIQLIVHAFSGGYLIAQYESYGYFEKALGALMNGMWCTSLVHTALLAVNRAVFIICFLEYRRIFNEVVFALTLGFCWTFFVFIFALDLTDYSIMVFVLPTYTFQYLTGTELGGFVREFSNYLILITVIVSAVSYVLIFGYVFTHTAPSKKEFLLTLQVFFICLYSIFGFAVWTYAPILDNPTSYFAANFIWILWNAINPYIVLIFNRRVREVLQLNGLFGAIKKTMGFVSSQNQIRVLCQVVPCAVDGKIRSVSQSVVSVQPMLKVARAASMMTPRPQIRITDTERPMSSLS